LHALLLTQRGVSPSQASSFFEPRYERDIHDPSLLSGMATAVERIVRAAQKSERVLVYGDYDADGITGTALLVSTLRELGITAAPFLPHRLEDGYGLNGQVLERLASEFELLITVDCGISNAAEISALRARGKDVLVVDHHALPDALPPALAILHPGLSAYPFAHLSGAGVAWKFSQALLREQRIGGNKDADQEKWLLDLCSLGTVADMVPMIGENRAIASFGFEVLRRTKRPGLRVLVDDALRSGQSLTAELISFRIVPLLNAAGRMDHAQPALDLLMTQRSDRASLLAAQLRRYNEARRTVSKRVQAEVEAGLSWEEPVIFAYSEHWPAGVLGLVAGRLSDKFTRPAVVIGNGGAHAVGSARAPAGFNVLEMMTTVREHVLKLGGHASAAGFSVARNRVADVRDALGGLGGAVAASGVPQQRRADALLDPALLDWDTLGVLERFQPYGEGNVRPSFVIRDAVVADWRPVGKTREHAKLNFRFAGGPIDGIGFGLAENQQMRALERGGAADILFHLDANEYMGRRTLQLQIKDIAPAGAVRIVEEGA
jgi:single-stranded-DNA-specific exonuclease